MKGLCLWIILITCYCPSAWAESWVLRFADPVGGVRESSWEIRKDRGLQYFSSDSQCPAYTLNVIPEGTQVVLANGLARQFSPGFLLLMDLPMPVFLPAEEGFKNGEHCFQEYVGKTAFQSCVNVTLADSLEQAQSLPTPQFGEVILVKRKGRLSAIIGPDFQAKRVDQE